MKRGSKKHMETSSNPWQKKSQRGLTAVSDQQKLDQVVVIGACPSRWSGHGDNQRRRSQESPLSSRLRSRSLPSLPRKQIKNHKTVNRGNQMGQKGWPVKAYETPRSTNRRKKGLMSRAGDMKGRRRRAAVSLFWPWDPPSEQAKGEEKEMNRERRKITPKYFQLFLYLF